MNRNPHRDYVRLSENDRESLLNNLDDAATGTPERPANSPQRRTKRFEFRRAGIHVSVEHPGGGSSQFAVVARNISSGGVAFLHGGFLHQGTRVRIILQGIDGKQDVVAGIVVNCRHVQDCVHEIGIAFERSIVPADFVQAEGDPGADTLSLQPEELRGCVLYLTGSEDDAKAVGEQIQPTNIKLVLITGVKDAANHVAHELVDIAICDPDAAEADARSIISTIRESGFCGPVVLVTSGTDDAKSAGADVTLGKPFKPADVLQTLTRIHQEMPAGTWADSVCSTLANDSTKTEAITGFVKDATATAGQLLTAAGGSDLPAVRAAAEPLIAAGKTHGFPRLTQLATDLVKSIDAGHTAEQVLPRIRELSLFCKCLATPTAQSSETSGNQAA